MRLIRLRSLLPALCFSFAALSAADAPATPAPTPTPASGETEEEVTPNPPPTKAEDPAATKFWQAIGLLESKQPADQAQGRRLLQETADLEYIHAQTQLGYCYASGSYGFAKDPRKAFNYYRLAAERGNGFAMVSLGTSYATGTGIRKDEEKAVTWLTAALADKADYTRPNPPADFARNANRAGSEVAGELVTDPIENSKASAHFLLGQIAARQKKAAVAQAHYIAAATAGPDGRSGIYQAAVEAALNYAFGRGVPRDPAKAQEMLAQSRQLGARMGVNLVHSYVSLKFVDEFAAADLEESVSEAGAAQQSNVQLEIARTLADKKSKDYNPAEAARWYELAAENGQVWAMLSLGLMHARGELGQPNYEAAFRWFEKIGGGDKPKHVLGIANLVICLQQGLGTPRDEARAAALCKKYLDVEIVCYLGTIGQAPTTILSLEEEQALLEKWAKEKNDPQAQTLLGTRILQNLGVVPGADEAAKWLKKAAKAGHGGALCQLGWLYQFYPASYGYRDPQKAAKAAAAAYKASGEAGNIEGLANYANCLSNGYGVPPNLDLAIATYEQCLKIDPDHSRTHSNLGEIYNRKLLQAAQDGTSMGTSEWRQQMLEHYEASARQEVSFAAILLGDLYYDGKLVKQDLPKAYGYYEQAANVPAHKGAAHFKLGFMHEFGQGVPVTYSEAAYHYRLAALEGNVYALRRLVNFYMTGTGVSADPDRAIFWLNALGRLGQVDAYVTMTDVLIKKRDYATALKLLKDLTNYPNPVVQGFAYERLSECYRAGNGVKQNVKTAEKNLQRAVELGNGDARAIMATRLLAAGRKEEALILFHDASRTSNVAAYNLGQMYYFGTNLPKDLDKALRFLWQSANDNNADALYFLAGLTWNRDEKSPNLDQAIELAGKAENLGHPKAGALRENLEQRRKGESAKPEENNRSRAS